MKAQLLYGLTAVILLLTPTLNFAQAPPLGTAAGFVLFSTIGAVGNTGISQITGNVGTNNGAITGFGNVLKRSIACCPPVEIAEYFAIPAITIKSIPIDHPIRLL